MLLPNPILQHIFSYLNYPERWQVARVCRQWYWMIHDPYLYQHLCFQDLELKALLVSLQKIIRIAPRPKSIRFQHCYSSFLQDTLIPVSFSRCDAPPLYTHIRHLQPAERRQQYQAYGFDTVHQAFSDQFAKLMQLGPVRSLSVIGCDLDLGLTEFFSTLICNGHALERFRYEANGDAGIDSGQMLQTLILATPHMRHFLGLHAGLDDRVLATVVRRWPHLRSFTLAEDRPGAISPRALWALLSGCRELKTVELVDLACLINRELAVEREPLRSIERLRVTKYVTMPLSLAGFVDLLRLFPNLNRLEYETNFNTFDNQFEGVTLDLFEKERRCVEDYVTHQGLDYHGQWYQPMTHQQYLLAGLLRQLDMIPSSSS
ncbi:hypothetical protein G6F43_002309 [Rhizopus delemar]|nr:hypothetical protein G6F43_002309 [Rhizopus delemar]